jgi:hypothetical protein
MTSPNLYIIIFIYFFRYETIETYDRAILSHIILASARVNTFISFMFLPFLGSGKAMMARLFFPLHKAQYWGFHKRYCLFLLIYKTTFEHWLFQNYILMEIKVSTPGLSRF